MVFEHRELLRVRDLVAGSVLLLEEVVHLRGRELVRVSAVDVDDDRVARLHVALFIGDSAHVPREDLLPHRHRTRCIVRNRQLDLAARDRL